MSWPVPLASPGRLAAHRIALVLLLVGCGASTRGAAALRTELSARLEAAQPGAPAVVADAERALEAAEAAEVAGDEVAAADHRALARLLTSIAEERAAEAAAREGAATLDAEATALETEAVRLETEAAATEAEASRIAAVGAAREEALRAWTRAEADEARGRRRGRLSLDDAAAMREAAQTIRARARLLAAAATELDRAATAEGALEVERLSSASSADADPIDALDHAEAAHRAARALLGLARRGHPVDETQIRALLEAATTEGFGAVRIERGVAIDLSFAFEGSATRPAPSALPRLRRLAAIASSHPAGQLLVEASGERARALSTALAAAGIEAGRLATSTAEGTRLVFVAYAPAAPSTATVLGGEAPATSAEVPAEPTPSGE